MRSMPSDAPLPCGYMTPSSTQTRMPYAVQAALVEAAGKLFWYWAHYEHFLRTAGVAEAAVNRLTRDRPGKYEVMRQLLRDLDKAGQRGQQVERQLVSGLVSVAVSADDCVDVAAAQAAQARLRAVAEEHGVVEAPQVKRDAAIERDAARQRRAQMAARARENQERTAKRRELFGEFCALLGDSSDRQGRGYRLEEILGEVATLDGVDYTPPFRKGTVTQTDGMLRFEGFHYLIEARWRMDPADVAAVAALAHKASRNLQSTRALFISMIGFRDEVVEELQTGVKNVLLLSGHELSLILEGAVGLDRALSLKTNEGAKKGRIFHDLSRAGAL